MRIRRLIVAAFAALSISSTAAAQAPPAVPSPPPPSPIDTAALHERLGDAGLVLLHVGPSADFAAGHIPGARPVTPADVSTPAGDGRLTLQLPDADTLRTRLQALGITDASTVVVYPATSNAVSQATRVVFTLDSLGLGARTRWLDGGLEAWRAAGHAVATGAPPAPASAAGPGQPEARLTLMPRPAAVAQLEDVRATIGAPASSSATVVVDARATDFYTGANDRGGAIPRPGHVPGAVSLPYTSFFTRARPDAPLVLKPRPALEAMLAAAGIRPGTSLITYCHIGQQATVPYVVARLLGYDVRLYDGSFEEWSATTAVPVDRTVPSDR